jgi:response regulator of citrate/malate metabolism
MTTAIGNDDVINESLKLGANDYLVKPFNLDKLEAAILNAIWHKYL